MIDSPYELFLAKKTKETSSVGRSISPYDCHEMLHDWQKQVVKWAVKKGRAAIFADCGLGKTFMQLEWARLSTGGKTIILAPLSVARQTIREASKIGVTVAYIRDYHEASSPGIYISNYEMIESVEGEWDAVVLDESSILKNYAGKMRNKLINAFASTPLRLACTATPAPNDVEELTNHSEFLGIMPRNEMLAAYFIHDHSDNRYRVKGHAVVPMAKWMADWCVAIRKPSDIGGSDLGYDLPALNIHSEIVPYMLAPEGQLFATELGGITGRSTVRKQTMPERLRLAARISDTDEQVIVWCGLNDEASQAAKLIDGSVNVHGALSPEAKAEALEAFQDGAIRVLITKPSIAGFGMNFQNARRMIFLGLSDSYESYYQSIRRCYRFGQTREVHAHIVVSDLEEQIVANVRRKETDHDNITILLAKHQTVTEIPKYE